MEAGGWGWGGRGGGWLRLGSYERRGGRTKDEEQQRSPPAGRGRPTTRGQTRPQERRPKGAVADLTLRGRRRRSWDFVSDSEIIARVCLAPTLMRTGEKGRRGVGEDNEQRTSSWSLFDDGIFRSLYALACKPRSSSRYLFIPYRFRSVYLDDELIPGHSLLAGSSPHATAATSPPPSSSMATRRVPHRRPKKRCAQAGLGRSTSREVRRRI